MNKHTPGPWTLHELDSTRILGKDGAVANAYAPSHLVTEADANARLIAAAPELLEALGALGVIGSGYCFCSHDRDPDKADHQPECRDARAALAKAEGR